MALLVCFLEASSEVDWSRKAIYLDQSFYEQLFAYYRGLESDSPLKEMVSIGYDDEFVLAGDRISQSLDDLENIAAAGVIGHPQVQLFSNVLRETARRGCRLVVAGDMHPDLSRA